MVRRHGDALHMNEKRLELATKRVDIVRVARRHQRPDDGQDVAKGGIEDHTVDRALSKGIGE